MFIDVDYPTLIAKKCDVIVNTQQLRDLLGHYKRQFPENNEGVHLSSEYFLALGCDLKDPSRLDSLFSSQFDASKSLILCTAEVSVTYMNVEAADALIQWAAHFDDST